MSQRTFDSVEFAVIAAAVLGLCLWLAGCTSTRATDRTTAALVADIGAAVERADAKLSEAEPLIENETPRTLVSQARVDLSDARSSAASAGRSAKKDADTLADQQRKLDRGPSISDRLEAWSVWVIVLGVGMAIAGFFLRSTTPILLELAPFVIAGGVLLGWLSLWWVQVLIGLLAVGAVAWFIFSPFPNLFRKETTNAA